MAHRGMFKRSAGINARGLGQERRALAAYGELRNLYRLAGAGWEAVAALGWLNGFCRSKCP